MISATSAMLMKPSSAAAASLGRSSTRVPSQQQQLARCRVAVSCRKGASLQAARRLGVLVRASSAPSEDPRDKAKSAWQDTKEAASDATDESGSRKVSAVAPRNSAASSGIALRARRGGALAWRFSRRRRRRARCLGKMHPALSSHPGACCWLRPLLLLHNSWPESDGSSSST